MRRFVKIEQQSFYDCGAACLCSIAAWHGVIISLAKARFLCGCTKEGITIKGIIDGGKRIGLAGKAYKSPEKDLLSLQKITFPAIAHTKTDGGLFHFVTLCGISGSSVTIMDPSKGKIIKVPHNVFAKSWTGYIVLFEPDKDFKKVNEKGNTYLKLLKLVCRYKSEMLHVIAGALATTVIGISTSIFLQKIIDYAIPQKNISELMAVSTAIIALALLGLFINYAKLRYLTLHGIKIDNHIISQYINKLPKLPLEFFTRYQPGDINSRVGDAFNIRMFLSEGVVSIFVSLFSLVVSIPIMFHYNSNLAILSLLFIPAYFGLYKLSGPIHKKHNKTLAESGARFETDLLHGIEGFASIRDSEAGRWIVQKIQDSYRLLAQNMYRASHAGILFGSSVDAISKGLISAILVSGCFSVLNDTITIGELVSFYTLCPLFSTPLSSLTNLNPVISQAIVSAERIFEIMELDDEDIYLHSQNHHGKYHEGDIIIKELSFSYPGSLPLFEKIDLKFEKGKMTLLNGKTGCGKSTLISLIMRNYKPDKGSILCGNTDIATLPVNEWREHIAAVPQKCHLFNASVLDNITCGAQNPDIKRIIEICATIGLLEKVESLPSGFFTSLGEDGVSFSGGEVQKVAIARALYKNPDILIFDESTASMDEASEILIADHLDKLKNGGKTIIVISHGKLFGEYADNIITIP